MTENISDFIKSEVEKNNIAIFMKGNKNMPMCGFSGAVVNIFNNLGVDYKDYNIMENDDLRSGIKEFSDWPTFPQIYVKGEFIGGCDILVEMYQSGELTKLLTDSGIEVKAA